MEDNNIKLKCFGKIYPLPRALIYKSQFLLNKVNNKHHKKNKIELKLDLKLESGFNIVYNKLLGKNGAMSVETFMNAIIIADYMNIEYILNDFSQIIRNGYIPMKVLSEQYHKYSNISQINSAVMLYLASILAILCIYSVSILNIVFNKNNDPKILKVVISYAHEYIINNLPELITNISPCNVKFVSSDPNTPINNIL